MITLRRLLDRWQHAVAADSLEDLASALTTADDPALIERTCRAVIVVPERARDAFAAIARPLAPELANALACVGVDVPATGALSPLAALALHGPAAAAELLPGHAEAPRIDDPATTVRFLIDVTRGGGDIHVAFAAWHAMAASVTAGIAGPEALLWVARVVRHGLGGEPLDTVGVWIHDTLERAASAQERSQADARARIRVELLDDPVRLQARPEAQLHAWEHDAAPLDRLLDRPLDQLGRELARTVLVDPRTAMDHAPTIIARLIGASPARADDRLAIADAANALECAGITLPTVLRERIAAWVPELGVVGPPLASRVRAGFAQLAYGHLTPAHRAFTGGLAFTNDLVAVLGYVTAAVRARAVVATLDATLERIAEELASRQLDEPTALWIARIAWHVLDDQPLGEIAARAHEWLWTTARDLETARGDRATHTRTFPLGRTLADGAFRIERWLCGRGTQRLYEGVELATGARVQIAFDDHVPNQDVAELRAAVDRHVPGMLDLVYVGTLDDDPAHWTIVERVHGEWLPRAIGPSDPWSPRKALELGRSAGAIMLRGAEAGVDLAAIRPELMWAERRDDVLVITGLSTRALELFGRSHGEARSHPVFERTFERGEPAELRLASMIATWAGDGDSALHALLDRARARRLSLAMLIAELGRL